MTLEKRKNNPEVALVIPVEPARLKELLAANFGHGGTPVIDRVTVPPGGGLSFQVPAATGPQAQQSLEGVVILDHRARAYWEKQGEATGTPPNCASQDGWHGVGIPGGLCMTCPLNEWDSGKDGRGKACKELHRIYLLQGGDTLPLLLTLPPTSLREWDAYRTRVMREGNTLQEVATSFTLTQDRAGGGQLFSRVVPISKGILPEAQARLAKDIKVLLEPSLLGVQIADEDYRAPQAATHESGKRGEAATPQVAAPPAQETPKDALDSLVVEGVLAEDPAIGYNSAGTPVVRVILSTHGYERKLVFALGELAESINTNLNQGDKAKFTGRNEEKLLQGKRTTVFVAHGWELLLRPSDPAKPQAPADPELPF